MKDILKGFEDIDNLTEEEKAKQNRDKTFDIVYSIYKIAINNYNESLLTVQELDFCELINFIIFDYATRKEEESSKEESEVS